MVWSPPPRASPAQELGSWGIYTPTPIVIGGGLLLGALVPWHFGQWALVASGRVQVLALGQGLHELKREGMEGTLTTGGEGCPYPFKEHRAAGDTFPLKNAHGTFP